MATKRLLGVVLVALAVAGLLTIAPAPPAAAAPGDMILTRDGQVIVTGTLLNPGANFQQYVDVVQPAAVDVCSPCTTTPQTVDVGYFTMGTEIVISMYVPQTGLTHYSDGPNATVVQLGPAQWHILFEDHTSPPVDILVDVSDQYPLEGGPLQWAALYGGTNPAAKNLACCQEQYTDYPVDSRTGNFWHTFNDLSIAGRGPGLAMSRSYNSLGTGDVGPFGPGWTFSYGMHLDLSVPGEVTLVQENGSRVVFEDTGSAFEAAPYFDATLTENVPSTGEWRVVRNDREVFTFDPSGALREIADLNENSTSLAYDADGLDTVTDSAGRALTFGWSGGHIVSVVDSSSLARSVSFTYDAGGRLETATDVEGGITTFTYASGRLETMRFPEYHGVVATPAPVVTNQYDAFGRVISQSDPTGGTTSFDYTAIPGATMVTDSAGNITVDYYGASGILVAQTKGYGTDDAATWIYAFDPQTAGRTTTIDPNGKTWARTYDSEGRLETVTDPLARSTSYTYGALDQVETVTDGEGVVTTYDYDLSGNLLSVVTPQPGSTPLVEQTVIAHHENLSHPGDVTKTTDPRGQEWIYSYNAAGDRVSMTDPEGNVTTWGYNDLGWATRETSPAGNLTPTPDPAFSTTIGYNKFGDVTTTLAPGQDPAHPTTRAYDGNRRLVDVTDAESKETSYQYDPAGRQLTVTRADASTLETEYHADGRVWKQADGAGNTTEYLYDHLGRLTSEENGLGLVTSYSYDAAGYLRTKTDPGGNCVTPAFDRCVTYGYDDAGQLVNVDYSDPATADLTAITYDDNGRRLAVTEAGGVITSSVWDWLGRLDTSTVGSQVTDYDYDLAGNLTKLQAPTGPAVVRTYDDAGRLETVNDGAGHTTAFAYDDNTLLETITYPGAVNVDTFDYDNVGRMTSAEYAKGSTSLGALGFERDDLGLVTGENVSTLTAADSTYDYNDLDQLGEWNSDQFNYDTADNLVQTPDGYQHFNAGNQVCWSAATTVTSPTCTAPPAGATTYEYDDRGNRTRTERPDLPASTYSYDQRNRLTEAEVPAVEGNQGQYHAVAPSLIMTTLAGFQYGTCDPSPCQRFTNSNTVKVKVAGIGGVPTSDVEAVTLSLSSYSSSSSGSVVVWRSDGTQPGSRNLYFTSGEDASNRVTTKLGTDGYVAVAVPSGATELIINVEGWYSTANGTAGGTFHALDATKVLDTRTASRTGLCPTTTAQCTALVANTPKTIQIAGQGGVPSTGVSAVAVNLTTISPPSAGHFKAYRSGTEPNPYVSIYYTPGENNVAQADLRLTNGRLDIRASTNLEVMIDVVGYWTSPIGQDGGQYIPLDPARVMSTTAGTGTCTPSPCAPIAGNSTVEVQIAGRGGLPNDGIAAASVNITVTGATADGALEIYPSDESTSAIRQVRYEASENVVNSITTELSADGKVSIRTTNGSTVGIFIDLQGYYSETGNLKWTYRYDADGFRTSKTSPFGVTTAYAWDKTNPTVPLLLSETTSGQTTRYIYGLGGVPLEQINPNGSVVYLHSDQLGSIRVATDSLGAKVGERAYTPYGDTIETSGTLPSPFGYAGQYHDGETDLLYMRARYYDPGTGQFMSRDPLVGATGDAYGYTYGNPLNMTDPSGLYSYDLAWNLGSGTQADARDLMTKLQRDPDRYFPFSVPAPICEGATLELSGQYSIGSVKVVSTTANSFIFQTMPGHVEGNGAVVGFGIYEKDGQVMLRVKAKGPDSWAQGLAGVAGLWGGNQLRGLIARDTWSHMALNLREELN